MRVLLAILLLSLSSCISGYRLGGTRPQHLRHVSSIAIPLSKNDTLSPRASAIATNSLVDAFTRDGSYRIGTSESANAVLKTTIRRISYTSIRSSRLDTLRPEELEMNVSIGWKLMDLDKPGHVLSQGTSTGTSRTFVGDNLQKARDNVLPDALLRASEQIVSTLADGI